MQDGIMLFSFPGVATTIMMLRSKAVATLKFEAINDEEKANAQIKFVAKKIVSETKHMYCKELHKGQ